MPRGRPPTPTAVKKLTGNPGKRALTADEPAPKPAPTTPPDYLEDDAKSAWMRLAADLSALGLLTTVDVDALAAYCVNFARWKAAEKKVFADGPVLMTADGNYYQNPYLAVANRALREMEKLGAEFGFSPAARVRLRAQPVDNSSELERALFGDDVKIKRVKHAA